MAAERVILVAGATGVLGREVVALLKAQGHRVRVLSRSADRGRAIALADEVAVGDAMQPSTIGDACRQASAIVSCVGASVAFNLAARRSYLAVDPVANGHLIDAAVAAGVQRFVYVGVHPGDGYARTAYLRAHELAADRLRASGIPFAVVQPTGLFPVFDAFLDMARRGFCLFPGDGRARSNPVHPADVAARCVEVLASPSGTVTSIGGPDVLTRQEIVELAFRAVSIKPRIAHVPPGVFFGVSRVLHPLHPRLGELIDFVTRAFTTDSVAPAGGRRRLEDYFAEVTAR